MTDEQKQLRQQVIDAAIRYYEGSKNNKKPYAPGDRFPYADRWPGAAICHWQPTTRSGLWRRRKAVVQIAWTGHAASAVLLTS